MSHTMHSHASTPTLSRTLKAAGAVALARLTKFRNAIRHRRAIARLAEQEERLLADIGISRCDVRDALRQPIWRDPSAFLRRRAGAGQAGGPMPVRAARNEARSSFEPSARAAARHAHVNIGSSRDMAA